jgi:hypothetical protein
MLHPYSIFFEAMWEEPTARRAPTDEQAAHRGHEMRWRMWWRSGAHRRTNSAPAVGEDAAITTATRADATRGATAG